MKDPKTVTITLGANSVNIGLDVRDADIIDSILNALTEYVAKGSPINIMQTYGDSMTESKRLFTKVISGQSQMVEWKSELKLLMNVMQQKPKM